MLGIEDIKELEKCIDESEVISFDIFDTLIKRLVNKPEDIFYLVGKKFNIYDFENIRVKGQHQASINAEKKGLPHADFDGIYEYLSTDKKDVNNWSEIAAYELELEFESLVCNKEIYSLYKYAKDKGKRVIAVSDMYLNGKHILPVLEKCGYTEIDAVYISSDALHTKFRGDIYDYVAEKEKVDRQLILHIGDNKQSDYNNALEHGWRAYNYKPFSFDEEKKYLLSTKIDYGTAETLIKGDFWYDLGVYAGGPLYMGIYLWLKNKLNNCDKKIFFMSRDGYNLYQLMKDELKDKAEYLYVSRRSMLFAGIDEVDEESLLILPPFTYGQSVNEIIDKFELPESFKERITEVGFDSLDATIDDSVDLLNFKELYKICKEDFLEKCESERKEILKYFSECGLFDEEIIAFDCGWNGSSQYLLDRIIKTAKKDTKVNFYYIGILDTNKSKTQLRGKIYDTFLFDHSTNYSVQEAVKRAIVVFELFFGAPHESVIGYENQRPVFENTQMDKTVKEKICEGIKDFVNTAKSFVACSGITYDSEIALAPILRLMEKPTEEEAINIGNIENADGFAEQKGLKKYIAYLKEEDYRDNPNIEIYWPEGLFKRKDIDCELKNRIAEDRGYDFYLKQVKEQDVSNADMQIKTEYEEWIERKEKKDKRVSLNYKPMFSVVIPVYNVTDIQLRECINSIIKQTYKNWELILVDDCSTWESVRKTLKKYERNRKIRIIYREENGHISKATNDGINIAKGDYIVFSDCDDVLALNALYEIAYKLNENKNYDFIYSDEDKISEDGLKRHSPFFKPDWSPDAFMSLMYTNHLAAYRTEIVKKIGGLRSEFNGAQDYDFTLRFMELSDNKRVAHIPKILYHWRERAESIASNMEAKPYALEAMRKLKEEALERRGLKGDVRFVSDMYQYRVVYRNENNPMVSIVIPSKDNFKMLKTCLNSIKQHTKYSNYEIIVVDNGSCSEAKKDIEKYLSDNGIRYIYKPMGFNFSKMCNMGVEASEGEYILLLNDDIEIFQNDWMDILVGQASLDYAGAVGAKLLYPDTDLIQHIGITNLYIGPSHNEMKNSDAQIYYFGRNRMNYNYLAVTGACLMVEKNKYIEAGMLDESLAIAYNDVDLGFSLYKKGYYNVVRNDVILYHHESVSRGIDDISEEKRKRLMEEGKKLYKKHSDLRHIDPFYNQNLTKYKGDYSIDNTKETVNPTIEKTNKYNKYQNDINGTIDSIEERADIIYIRGWVIASGKLDKLYKRFLLFQNDEDEVLKVKLKRTERKDIADAFGESKRWCGFEINIPREFFDVSDKEYKAYFYVRDLFGIRKRCMEVSKGLKLNPQVCDS